MPGSAAHIEDTPGSFRNHPASLGNAIAIIEAREKTLRLFGILSVWLVIRRIIPPHLFPGRPGVEIDQPTLLAPHQPERPAQSVQPIPAFIQDNVVIGFAYVASDLFHPLISNL
jgi:hypothetical protein